jgi:hypothetical protein
LDRARALPGERRAVEVDTGRWRPALPEDAWPRRFPEDGRVWRQDVFAVAQRWRDGRSTARQLTAAVLMWHYGSTSSGRRRTVRTLADDPSGARIEAVLHGLRGEQPTPGDLRGAYQAFRTGCHLHSFDPDTSTRLLYFAGYRRGIGGTQPLILSAEIARNIPRGVGVTSPANRGSSLEWARYIGWAAERARGEVEADLIEMDLATGGERFGQAAQLRAQARGRHARR